MNTVHLTPIRRAVDQLGSQRALAAALGVTAVTVNQWLQIDVARRRPVPPKQCVRIERLTGGRISRRDLRPDDWEAIWPELADPATRAAAAQTGEGAHA